MKLREWKTASLSIRLLLNSRKVKRVTVRELIERLTQFDQNLQVEIATQPNEDEWYEIYDIEVLSNYRGNAVLVINTD